jgi:hypothetical protein
MPLSANSNGILTGQFTIPANVPAGTKLVEFTGAGGTYGAGQFTGRGELLVRRIVRTRAIGRPIDPLAQTFTLTRGRHVTAVDITFTTKGGGEPVQVEIRETENGIPTQTVLADARIRAADIDTTANWVRATFDTPVWLEGSREYALVLLTNDANHAVAVAELGKYDATEQQWVTSQPYTVGLLLSSSNASTWTPHQEKDLRFRLVGARFTSTTREVELGSAAATNISDLLGVAPFDRPTAATSLAFKFRRGDGTIFRAQPGQPISFDTRQTADFALVARLTGNEFESPVLYPGAQQIRGGLDESAIYVTRQIPVGTSKVIKVIFDAIVPGSALVQAAYETSTPGTYQTLSNPVATQLGDGLVEYAYTSGTVSITNTRVRLTLTGNTVNRPRVRNLRVVVV